MGFNASHCKERVKGIQSERIIGSFTHDSATLTKRAPKIPFSAESNVHFKRHQQGRWRQPGWRALRRRRETVAV